MKVAETRDSVLATKIALYALPKDIYDSDDRPVVAGAERLLRFASRRVFSKYDELGVPFKFISDNTIKANSQIVNVVTGECQYIDTDTSTSSMLKRIWEVLTNAGYRVILRGLRTNSTNSIAIFVCSIRRVIIIWDLTEKKEIASFSIDHIESYYNLYFIFDDNYIVYSCKTETKIVNGKKQQLIFTHDKQLINLRFDNAHQRIIWLEGGRVYSFNVKTEQYEECFDFVKGILHSFQISEDNRFIVGANDEGIVVYNYITNKYVTNISIDGHISSYDIFGALLCTIYNRDDQNYITVYDIYNDKFIYQRCHKEKIGHYSMSPNQHYIAYELYNGYSKSYVIIENLRDNTFKLFASMNSDTNNVNPILDFTASQDEIFVLYPDRTRYINKIDVSQNIDNMYAPGSFPLRKIGILEDAKYLKVV